MYVKNEEIWHVAQSLTASSKSSSIKMYLLKESLIKSLAREESKLFLEEVIIWFIQLNPLSTVAVLTCKVLWISVSSNKVFNIPVLDSYCFNMGNVVSKSKKYLKEAEIFFSTHLWQKRGKFEWFFTNYWACWNL